MQLFDLTGKTALITGAARGIGERIAYALSHAGARVILTDCTIEKLKITGGGYKNALIMEMNVACKESVYSTIKLLEEQGEKIDICVNNAGIAKPTPIFEMIDSDDFENIIQVNLIGVWYVTQALAIHMKKNNIQGSIINIGSINGAEVPALQGSAYNASKAAIMHMAKGLVGELSPHNIRINSICAGFFPTEMSKKTLETLGDDITNFIPLGFVASLSDLDGLIIYLASNNASRYLTGSCITLDGGVSCRTLTNVKKG